MEESKHHTIQLSKGDGHLTPDFLLESRALTPNVDGDGAMDYGDFNSEQTEYVIFDCFINLHIDTIEYLDCIMNIFDMEDEQIRALNLTDSNASNIVKNLTNFKSFESLNTNLNIAIKQSSLNFNSRGSGFPTVPLHGLEYNNNFRNFKININDIDIDDAADKLGLLITPTAIMEQRSSLENDDKYSKNSQANLCDDYTDDEYTRI